MSIQWCLYRGLIDRALAETLSREQQESILQRKARHRVPYIQALRSALVPFLVAVAYFAAMTLIKLWADRRMTDSFRLLYVAATYTVLLAFFFPWIARARSRRPFYLALRDHGHEVCVQCGYWLRELDDSVKQCPECGAKREPMPAAPVDLNGRNEGGSS